MRLQVGNDVIEVPDGLSDDQYDQIAAKHARSLQLEGMQQTAQQDMAGRDPFTRGAYGFANAVAEPIVGVTQFARQKLGMDTTAIDEQIAQRRGARAGAGTAGTVGEVGAFLAPGLGTEALVANVGKRMLPRALAMSAAGATEQGLYEAARATQADDPLSRAERARIGATGGAVFGAGGELAGRGLTATMKRLQPGEKAQQLIDWAKQQGVDLNLTPGQAGGVGSFRGGIEDALTAVPGVKQIIDRRRAGAVQGFNNAQLAAAVRPITGDQTPTNLSGVDGIKFVQQQVDDAYRRAVDGVTIAVPANANPFVRTQKAISELPPPDAEIAQKAHDLTLEAVRSGKVAGESITQLRSRIDKLASQYYRQGNYALGEALDQLDDDFRGVASYFMSPEQRKLLQKANAAYTRLKPINRAAGYKEAVQNDSRFSPSQLVGGVTRGMPDAVKARAGSPQLQEAILANQVLGPTLPRPGPGTAEKLIVSSLFGGGGIAAADALMGQGDPVGLLGPGIGAAAAMGLAGMSPAAGRSLMYANALRGPTRAAATRLAVEKKLRDEEEKRRRERGY